MEYSYIFNKNYSIHMNTFIAHLISFVIHFEINKIYCNQITGKHDSLGRVNASSTLFYIGGSTIVCQYIACCTFIFALWTITLDGYFGTCI